MRVLIGYDGSKSAEAAIDDLARAGLPRSVTAEIISVVEAWIHPDSSMGENSGLGPSYLEKLVSEQHAREAHAGSEAKMLARFAEERVRSHFPDWQVSSSVAYGSPAREILNKAEESKADLIVVGSYGHSTLSRFILGSISQKVLAEASCSVRVGRGSIDIDSGPERIIIGYDGSQGSAAAVTAVAERSWHGAEVRLISVTESLLPSTIGRFVAPIGRIVDDQSTSDRVWLEKLVQRELDKLHRSGLAAEFCISPGNPREVLIEHAERWGADCIFAGANGWGNKLERMLLGSTSAAVAARASCSVEVVLGNAIHNDGPGGEI